MPTIEQIRAARALIGWSQKDLADNSGLSQTGIARIENGTNHPNSSTIAKITAAFDKVDVEFIGDSGVRKRTGEVRTLRGQQGFEDFITDVYNTIEKTGGEICVSNVDERQFDKWLNGCSFNYLEKMRSLVGKIDFSFKILICEGDNFQIATYAKYRKTNIENFSSVPFYVFGNKTAIIIFDESVVIHIIENKEIADAQRKQFNVCWGAGQS